ncbi:MAG: osmoprotectant transport system substrate-binding protein [Thermomicrobiales bacterium]|nr:osmoprotectant transport system substrate-binding protein [Thermomicrobiales bacterium]
MVTRRTFVKAVAAAPLLGRVLSIAPSARAQSAGPIRVGSKDFPEAVIIGEMYALLLENAGLQVERKLNLGGTAVAHEALKSGELDVYPEYTGTGLLVVLGKKLSDVPGLTAGTPEAGGTPAATDAVDAVYQYVKDEYKAQFNLVWLDQTPMNDSQALAVTRQFSEEHGVATISQLVALASSVELVFSAPVDFEEREDGLKGLRQTYGDFPAKVNGVAPGVKYQALLDGDANVVLAFSTDAEIAINDLVVLEDDKELWPPYHVAPVVRQEALDANPGLAPALNALAPVLTTELMIGLNARVIGEEKVDPAFVAKDFLTEQGLISA